MQLKSLTYTSLARLDLGEEEVVAIHRTARDLNALDGITGLLIFNGTHFLQIVEGAETAVDDLFDRLRRDRRHSGLELRDERAIEQRSFPDWSMELVKVKSSYFDARRTITDRLPANIPSTVRDHIFAMTELISGDVTLDD